MYSIILVAHGQAASALKQAASMIAGQEYADMLFTIDFRDDQSREELSDQIEAQLKAENNLVLCDIKGGTPFNAAYLLGKTYPVRIMTGVNLAMILEILLTPDKDTENILQTAADSARESVQFY